jgi:predicted regulator of Ras-like GTPase activity (Roadblock/LC7/MglB family)
LNAVGTKSGTAGALSQEARSFRWLLRDLVEEVPGIHSVAVVSSDGLLLVGSEPDSRYADEGGQEPPAHPGLAHGSRMDLAAVVSGLASLTVGAAQLMDGGRVRQTTVAMAQGVLVVMSISDGSLLGVHASADCDLSVVAYQMALFVGRAGHALTPALRSELRQTGGADPGPLEAVPVRKPAPAPAPDPDPASAPAEPTEPTGDGGDAAGGAA